MKDLIDRKLRMLIDLQACNSMGSKNRGIGNYSYEFFKAICVQQVGMDIWALHKEKNNETYDFSFFDKRKDIIVPEMPSVSTERDYKGGNRDTIDSILCRTLLETYQPDVIHVSSVFEGIGERIAIPNNKYKSKNQILSATLYDLIPYRFPENYLPKGEPEKSYLQRLHWYRNADLLLSISETTKQDAVDLLNIDPNKIVTIHGGIADVFRKKHISDDENRKLYKKFGILGKYVMYTGGDDFRKNIDGAIRGFSLLPKLLLIDLQLVIVCKITSEAKKRYKALAAELGLPDDRVVITGFVSTKDLVNLYNCCHLFIFPSIYEGLGLPVLEAMACEVPAIGGNNSSVREIIGTSDALFDVRNPQSISDIIYKTATNDNFRTFLIEHGKKVIKKYTWSNAAQIAINAFEEKVKQQRNTNVFYSLNTSFVKKKLAYFTPLPPIKSGIADYITDFIPFLATHFEIDIYVDKITPSDSYISANYRVYSSKDFDLAVELYDGIIYEFGNSEHHAYMLPFLQKYSGIVILHDAYLSGLMDYLKLTAIQSEEFIDIAYYSHGGIVKNYVEQYKDDPILAIRRMIDTLPCNKKVLDNAIGVIAFSEFNRQIIQSFYPTEWLPVYEVIPQPISSITLADDAEINRIREQMGYSSDAKLLCTFGHITYTKYPEAIVESFLELLEEVEIDIYLIFVGKLSEDKFGIEFKEKISKSVYQDRIIITGYLSKEKYENYLKIADLTLQLRSISRGETSRAVLQNMSYGKPVIVNNFAGFKEYDSDLLIKVSPDPLPTELKNELYLFFVKNKNINKGNKAYEYVKKYHNPRYCAARFAVVVKDIIERHQHREKAFVEQQWAPLLGEHNDPTADALYLEEWLNQMQPPNRARRKLLLYGLEYTQSTNLLQEVFLDIYHVIRYMICTKTVGVNCVPVNGTDLNNLTLLTEWMIEQDIFSSEELSSVKPFFFGNLTPRRGDMLVWFVDLSTIQEDNLDKTVLAELRHKGVYLVLVLYISEPKMDNDNFQSLPINDAEKVIVIDSSSKTEYIIDVIGQLNAKDKVIRLDLQKIEKSKSVDLQTQVSIGNKYSSETTLAEMVATHLIEKIIP